MIIIKHYAAVAQSVEQRTENPRVNSSILFGGNIRKPVTYYSIMNYRKLTDYRKTGVVKNHPRDTRLTPGTRNKGFTMQERLPFVLYKRTLKSGKKVFYAKFLKQDGAYTSGRSTGKTNRKAAEIEAWKYLSNGRITGKQNIKLKGYARNFFDWNGEWAISKRSAGLRISEDQCKTNQARTDKHIIGKIGELLLSEIDTAAVKALRNRLYREGFAGSTINKILGCLRAILEAAEESHLLRYLPRIQRAGLNQREKGILSLIEVKELFSLQWSDRRVYAANLISASTGFRLGEVLGIKRKNIKAGYIEITGSYCTRARHYKHGTKNGQTSRSVPIPESIQTIIDELLKESPYKDPESFLLHAPGRPEKPIEHILIVRGFYNALGQLDPSIKEDERIRRNITFHSHRHFFNSLLIESRIPLQKIQQLTGHLSTSMTERYYHLGGLEDVAAVQREMFQLVKTG